MGLYDPLIQGSDYQSVKACLSEQFLSPNYPAALHILHLIPRIIPVSRYGSKSDLMFYFQLLKRKGVSFSDAPFYTRLWVIF